MNAMKPNEKRTNCGHHCVYWQNTVNISVFFGNSITKVATIIWCFVFFFHFDLNAHSRLISLARNWIVHSRKWQHTKKKQQNRPKYSKHFIQIHSHPTPYTRRHKTMAYLDRLAYYLILRKNGYMNHDEPFVVLIQQLCVCVRVSVW